MAHQQNGRNFDPGTRAILTELRDLRVEMRADRRQDQEERRQDREERRQDREERRQDRQRSDERFELLIRAMREESVRRDAATQRVFTRTEQAFKDIHTVGLSIVKALNLQKQVLEHHGRLLERIDRKLGTRGNGRPGPENGRR